MKVNNNKSKELKDFSDEESEDSSINSSMESQKPKTKPTKNVDIKMCLIGDSQIGKSALLHSYIYKKFFSNLGSTIEDKYSIPAEIDEYKCNINITDTSGDKEYQQMFESWVNSSDGFILAYAIDNQKSFENLKTKYEQIMEIKSTKEFFALVVGCKGDLENNRQVNKKEIEEYCKINNLKNIETSAQNNNNVKECFLVMVNELLNLKFPNRITKSETTKKKICYCF